MRAKLYRRYVEEKKRVRENDKYKLIVSYYFVDNELFKSIIDDYGQIIPAMYLFPSSIGLDDLGFSTVFEEGNYRETLDIINDLEKRADEYVEKIIKKYFRKTTKSLKEVLKINPMILFSSNKFKEELREGMKKMGVIEEELN
jgi:hypothetical protein